MNDLTIHDTLTDAYTAGLLDGEGCISMVQRYNRKKMPFNGYKVEVSIVNTNKDIIDWLKITYGGTVCVKRRSLSEKHKIAYHWYIAHKKMEVFLKRVLPYLKIKRLQAEIALEYRNTVKKIEVGMIRGVTKEVAEKRVFLKNRINELNRKGPSNGEQGFRTN